MSSLAYYELKAAQALFNKNRSDLDEAEQQRVEKVAARYQEIESLVLATPEAQGVAIAEADLEKALGEISERYGETAAFEADLARLKLDIENLTAALHRDLLVEAVMNRVGAEAGKVEPTEAEIFYYAHKERFSAPERRVARHILVTINDDFADNTREAAARRIRMIRERLDKKPERFEEQALKHSECPTAMNGGLLGKCTAGQLFPALDAALFALDAGQISEVLESEVGFHILRCDEILPGGILSFEEVCDSLCQRLTDERARKTSQAWLKALLTPQPA